MNFQNLTALEDNMAATGNNGEYNLQKFSLPVNGESLKLNGMLTTPKGRSKYYYAVEHPKQRIVLHFTAGHIRSDLNALTRNEYHVSVPFVIGRNGVIYQLFLSKFWSGHIGKGIGNTNTGNAQDKVTIGIELSNYGFLTEKNGNLETYYSRQKDDQGNIGPADIYCSLAEQSAFQKIPVLFRQQSYYASYTPAQYDSLIILLRYLTAQYKIPREFLPESTRYQTSDEVLSFKGIVSHINYRPDGKWDIGPGFDWQKVIQGVQASQYTAVFANAATATRGMDDFENFRASLHSEEQMEGLLPEPEDAAQEDQPYEN